MPFVKGRSGNPAGRPKKPRAEKVSALRADLLKVAPEVLEALKQAAKAGDPSAAKLILDRCLPVLRAVDVPVSLPLADGQTDLAGAAEAVLKALVTGGITPDQASSVAAVLASLAKAREVGDLEQRIADLEARHGEQG